MWRTGLGRGRPRRSWVDPGALNDDRVGGPLDAVAPELSGIVGSIGAGAIATFGIDVARLPWDMTSISLYGDYEHPVEGFVEPRYGHPKDRRPDLKQVQTGLGVSGDGWVPVFHRAYDRGAGEEAQVVPALEALKKMAGERSLLMLGDSSSSPTPCRHRQGRGAPASKSYVPAAVLAACDFDAATPVDYVAGRDGHKQPEGRGSGRVTRTP